jgi:DNA invertase Pin-like site-specific DNA recombinase
MPKFLQYLLGSRKKKNNLANKGNLPTLEDLKREYIDYILEITLYNVTEAAKILDISRTTLYNKLNKYDIPIPRQNRLEKKSALLSEYPLEKPEAGEGGPYVN